MKIVFWNIFVALLLHMPWHLPLLAQPGPRREAIHCAFLSSFICASILIATCLLLAASLAAGVIRPTLAKVHMACALTAHVDTRRRYCPTMVPRRCSDSCLPVDRQMCATLASAQVWTSAWRSSEPSPSCPPHRSAALQMTAASAPACPPIPQVSCGAVCPTSPAASCRSLAALLLFCPPASHSCRLDNA